MAKTNTNCLYCGKPYYVCKACEDIHSWKNVSCSIECFRKLSKIKSTPNKIKSEDTLD